MRILLAGAGGQLGRSLQAALQGHGVRALPKSELDIRSLAAARAAVAAFAPDLVINAAAYNEVDEAESHHEEAFRANALGPRNLALATAEAGAAVLHVSTDYVFDGAQETPYDEFAEPRPLSAYGRSKLAGEEAVRAANSRHYIVRTAWLFHPDGRNFPNTILRLAGKGPVRVVRDQVGSPTYAPHLAAGIETLIKTGAYGTYHMAGAGATSWYDLTRALFALAEVSSAVEPCTASEFPRPAQRPRYSALTTIQDPKILLPAWEEGLSAFVGAKRAQK